MTGIPAKYLVLLFVLSLAYTWAINALNIRSIRMENPANEMSSSRSLVYNSTVYSVDNYWYVNHIKNLLEHGRFTVDITKDRYEVRRTPVYPLFYGLHYLLFGEEKSYYYIRYTQAFLLALAVVALCCAMWNFTGSRLVAVLSAVIYGLYPTVPIAAFYTMTESISSELVCFCLFFLSLAKIRTSQRYWFLAGLFFALAVLCRPTVIFLALSVAWLIWYTGKPGFKKMLSSGSSFAAGAILLFLPWTVRNYTVTGGDLVFLEKFYGDPMDYGMPNIRLREWISCWTNPADFTSENVSNTMQHNLITSTPLDREVLVGNIVGQLPERAFTGNTRHEVDEAFDRLYAYYTKQMSVDKTGLKEAEQLANQAFITLANNFRQESPAAYYVLRPLIFLKSIVFQSNASSMAFLDGYATDRLRWAGKVLMYVINIFSWGSLLFLFFFRRRYADIYWMTVFFVSATVAGSLWIISYYEARYTVPAFPMLFGMLSVMLAEIYGMIKKLYTVNDFKNA